MGDVHEHFYYTYNSEGLTPQYSGWIEYPTVENPSTPYKFISFEFHLKKDLVDINRQTYSALDWLGDTGGLIDGLYHFLEIFIAPFSALALQSSLMT